MFFSIQSCLATTPYWFVEHLLLFSLVQDLQTIDVRTMPYGSEI
ncbi:MAG: hypothetical protein OJF50_004005 [Nitrospira sp.]|nr:hypothetical protein [Nitrospira sp.]